MFSVIIPLFIVILVITGDLRGPLRKELKPVVIKWDLVMTLDENRLSKYLNDKKGIQDFFMQSIEIDEENKKLRINNNSWDYILDATVHKNVFPAKEFVEIGAGVAGRFNRKTCELSVSFESQYTWR